LRKERIKELIKPLQGLRGSGAEPHKREAEA